MGLVAALTAAMSIWIVLWALGSKGFDAFMLFVVILVTSVALRMIASRLSGRGSSDG